MLRSEPCASVTFRAETPGMTTSCRIIATALFATRFLAGSAHEGMWLPTLLQAIEGQMRTEGMMISAEDIYSLNNGSLKDATVLFGGGCTAEVISKEGLILTNLHCGFSAIADHSSVEKDYLKNGFWAASRGEELSNPGLSATFIIRMEDVSARVLGAVLQGMGEAERAEAISATNAAIVAETTLGPGQNAVIKPFNYGNSYYLIVSETYKDVRLVGAPPGSIGNFGGDTDNWMWPRHTGDFSLFRIYADAENKPAPFALTNVPFKPRRSLAISMDGVKEGDFAMIFGFPGNTQRYLPSDAVEYIQKVGDPLRIRMRRASLAVIDEAMLSSDRTRIAYADKQKSISNAYKKWIGELRGITELGTVARKHDLEREYRARAQAAGRLDLIAALDSLEANHERIAPYAKARDLFSEFYGTGNDLLRFVRSFEPLLDVANVERLKDEGKLQAEIGKARARASAFHKDFDPAVDRRIMEAQLPIYLEQMEPGAGIVLPGRFATPDAYVQDIYARSIFVRPQELDAALASWSAKRARKLSVDPAVVAANAFVSAHATKVKPVLDAANARLAEHMRLWMGGLMTLFPERTFWPDANSTLRLSYGQVEGSQPRDGMIYEAFTSLDGVLEKYRPNDPEFDAPARLLELHAAKDYGPYGTPEGMPVCFTSSLHTTGGNSGSPVLNGRGELIGINFDRTWESTMSDLQFDPEKCRNISTDIRYVLFVVDKVCGAHHLIEELELVHHTEVLPVIQLPIHR